MDTNIGYKNGVAQDATKQGLSMQQRALLGIDNKRCKEVTDKIESKSSIFCTITSVLCIAAFIFCLIRIIAELTEYDPYIPVVLSYAIYAVCSLLSCIFFRLLRYICIGLVILLKNGSN